MSRSGTAVVGPVIMMEMESFHRPVLVDEVIGLLEPRPGGRYLDGTIGGGGHARAILEASHPDGEVWGVDLDPDAVRYCGDHLREFGGRVHLVEGNYSRLETRLGGLSFDGALLDLGISSFQIDRPERGFSSRLPAPLDMRFDPRSGETASMILNTAPEERLAEIFLEFGEERRARRIARAVARARKAGPIEDSRRLTEIIVGAVPGDHEHKSVARIFQALRISVNHEIENLERGLDSIFGMVVAGGRFAVISYHSLEDRKVKRYFRYLESDCLCPADFPECRCDKRSEARVLTRRPIRPSAAAVESNPRSRSARLRAILKRLSEK